MYFSHVFRLLAAVFFFAYQFVLMSCAHAQIPVEHFFQPKNVLEAQLSPSGTTLVMTIPNGENGVGVAVIDLTQQNKKKIVLVRYEQAEIEQFSWVGDQRIVFNLADLRTDAEANKNSATGLYTINLKDGEVKHVTHRASTHNSDYKLLHVPQQVEGAVEHEVVVSLSNPSDAGTKSITPLWLNLQTGETHPMSWNVPGDLTSVMFDSYGQPRLLTTKKENRLGLYWRGPDEESWQRLSVKNAFRGSFRLLKVDDHGNLYVIASPKGEGYAELKLYDFNSGGPQNESIGKTLGFDFEGSVQFDAHNVKALGVRSHAAKETTIWFDDRMKNFQTMIDQRRPGYINNIDCRRCGEADMVALIWSYSDRHPGTLYRYQASTNQLEFILDVMDGIDSERMASVNFQRIKARDGREIPIWITQPETPGSNSPPPAVVLVHGGPWMRGGYWKWRAMEQFLASRGYVVISPEFRGSEGYGAEHYQAGFKQWGESMQNDVADALMWAQKQGLASDKACIAGDSYGGYSTLMGLIKHPNLYQCGIAWSAISDMELYLKGSPDIVDDIPAIEREHLLPKLVGDFRAESKSIKLNSPVLQAHRIQSPVLLAHGGADFRIPIAHGHRMREALKKAGQAPEWVEYPKEGHGWNQVETKIDFALRLEKFLKKHLK